MKQVKLNIDKKTYEAVKKACKKKIGILEKSTPLLIRISKWIYKK